MADKTDGIRVVRESFWIGNEMMRRGATVRASHPFVKKRPEMFYPENYVDFEWPERS